MIDIRYSDLHMHGDYSDGRGSLREFAQSALAGGLDTIGFSDHSPVPLKNAWSTKKEKFSSYVDEVIELKKEYEGRLDILLGVELDYIDGMDVKGYMGFDDIPFDYFIGSVHYVYSDILGGYHEVDGPPEEFDYLFEKGFGSDADRLVKQYYSSVRKMASAYRPDFIGHIDLVKKNNTGGKYFSENSRQYMREVNDTLDTIKGFKIPIEINTGAISRGYTKTPYPSEHIMDLCFQKGIKITLNSDAHRPDDVAYMFDEMMIYAGDSGFREILMNKAGDWKSVML